MRKWREIDFPLKHFASRFSCVALVRLVAELCLRQFSKLFCDHSPQVIAYHAATASCDELGNSFAEHQQPHEKDAHFQWNVAKQSDARNAAANGVRHHQFYCPARCGRSQYSPSRGRKACSAAFALMLTVGLRYVIGVDCEKLYCTILFTGAGHSYALLPIFVFLWTSCGRPAVNHVTFGLLWNFPRGKVRKRN